jgi:hypothetical protein
MTFFFVFLIKYKCTKIVFCWLGFSILNLLGAMGGVLFWKILQAYNIGAPTSIHTPHTTRGLTREKREKEKVERKREQRSCSATLHAVFVVDQPTN